MRNIYVIGLLLLYPAICFTQATEYPNKFWQPLSLTGAVKLGGGYRYKVGTTNTIYNYEKTPIINGGISLNSDSYFWHPNFLKLNVGVEYNPEYRQETFLVIPDRSEVRTVKRIDGTATFFQEKNFTITGFGNYNESFTNRENLSNVKVNSANLGGNLSWSNRVVPLQVHYVQNKWNELEIQTNRRFITHQKNLRATAKKSFSTHDRNELVYFHNDFRRVDPNAFETKNISDNFNLNNSVYFDKGKKYTFNSLITGTDQKGTDTYKRLQAFENICFNLPANLRFMGNYTYSKNRRQGQVLTQNNVNASLSHQLFRSLNTSVIYEYVNIKHTVYSEVNNKVGISLNYDKEIPTGHLYLSYSYYRQNQKRNSESFLLQILDEEHILTDGEIVLLDKPYVLSSTVQVKDITGTIVYQPFLDYILIDRNTYIEIQRVPGGQIINGAVISVNYMVNQPGSYQYNVNFMNISAGITLFNRLVELYYRRNSQDYDHLRNVETLTLNYLTENIYGIKLEYKFASVGAEYDDYNSSIIPYKLWRYYIQLQGDIGNRLLFSLNGNLRDYHLLDNDTRQQYADIMGNVAYVFNPRMKLNVEVGYRKQIGQEIDLDLVTMRSELIASYRKLFLKLGVEYYHRIYLGEQVDYYGAYIQLIRTFGWTKK